MNLMLGSGMVCVDSSLFFFYYESHTAASFSSARSDYIIYIGAKLAGAAGAGAPVVFLVS